MLFAEYIVDSKPIILSLLSKMRDSVTDKNSNAVWKVDDDENDWVSKKLIPLVCNIHSHTHIYTSSLSLSLVQKLSVSRSFSISLTHTHTYALTHILYAH